MLRPRSIGLLLALITLLVYLPATSYQFINFDDPEYVSQNIVVQNGLTWAGVKWSFMGAHASNWHPLTWLSHMADCDLFRLNPAGPHLVNILLHSVNAALIFTLFFRLTKKLWPSAFIAALFAWHPLHIESVAWISERKDVLSTFFTLLTLLSYTRYVQENQRRSFWFAVLFFALALLSKPMPVTLPLVMLFLDYWPLKRFEGYQSKVAGSTDGEQLSTFNFQLSTVLEKWPFFMLTTISCVITFLAQHHAESSLANVPLGFRLENVLTAYAGYLWKMVWPTELIILYPLRAPIAWQLVAQSVIVLTGISVIVWRERKTSPWLTVGWLWFLVTLLPVIGLVQVGSQSMADRYTYFPLVGIFLAIGFSADAVAENFIFLKKWFTPVAILILGGCVLLTEKQLSYWHDSESLFTHALTVEDSASAHISLGGVMRDQNRMREAMSEYIRAWLLNPESVLANGNVAYMLDAEGKTALAADYYQRAVNGNFPSPAIHKNYGMVLSKLGRYAEAMSQYSIAAQMEVTSADSQALMAELLLLQGRDAEALTHLRIALELDPNNLGRVILTANLLAAAEDPHARNGVEARAIAEKLVKRTGDQQAAALDALAMADAEIGRFDEAVQLQQKAVNLVEANGPKEDLVVMQKRLETYQQHKPWRESFKRTPTPEKLTAQ
jgi:tetratricopeptide (TPR) repeat protein